MLNLAELFRICLNVAVYYVLQLTAAYMLATVVSDCLHCLEFLFYFYFLQDNRLIEILLLLSYALRKTLNYKSFEKNIDLEEIYIKVTCLLPCFTVKCPSTSPPILRNL